MKIRGSAEIAAVVFDLGGSLEGDRSLHSTWNDWNTFAHVSSEPSTLLLYYIEIGPFFLLKGWFLWRLWYDGHL
jgi:hypothetical protein